MRRIALLMLASCSPLPELLPPNLHETCTRAIECEMFAEDELSQCAYCLEHMYPETAAFDPADCRSVKDGLYAISRCVELRWGAP